MKKLSIVVPAYNEERAIGIVLDQLRETMEKSDVEYEIIVVDDNSEDATPKAARKRNVKLLRNRENKGYGSCIKEGIRNARYDLIAIIDADGSYPVKAIPQLLENMGDCDMVVGARTGKDVRIPPIRRLAKWFLRRLASYLAGVKIPDLNSGLRIFRKEVAEEFSYVLPSGFSFTSTITLAMLCNAFSVEFVPIDYYKRAGKSKIKPLRDSINFFQLIVRTVMYFSPLKIFLPLSIALFFVGILVFLYSWLFSPKIMDITVAIIITTSIQVAALGLLADLIGKRRKM